MDSGAAESSAAGAPAFYIGRGEEVYGPYPRGDIEQMLAQGQFLDSDHVWNEGAQSWIPLPEFLNHVEGGHPETVVPAASQTAELTPAPDPNPGPAYPCENHTSTPAAGHCGVCSRLLCASCLRYKAGTFFCESCAAAVRDEAANPFQERIEKTLGVFYHQPLYAVVLILFLAVVLMPSAGNVHAQRTEGIDAVEANRLWKQAQDSLIVANAMLDDGQTARATAWFRLALKSASKVAAEKSISNLIREQALMFQMRIALDIEDYDLLHRLLEELESKIERVMREGDRIFFEGCDHYLYGKNPEKAIERFEHFVSPVHGDIGGPAMSIDLMIEVMSKPTRASGENLQRLTAESFSIPEVKYRLGVCYEMDGRKDQARDLFYELYKMPANESDIRWRRMAIKKVEALGGEE